MKQRKLSSTTHPTPFLMVLSSDHISAATGLNPLPTVTISKDGAAFGAAAGAVSEIGNGWYSLAGNATDRGTLGELVIHATAATADPTDEKYVIVPWDPFDANLSLTNLDIAVSTRSTYAGADTAGTTTLLSRVTAAVALAGSAPSWYAAPVDVSANVLAIKTKTDLLTFTAAGSVDANVRKVNGVNVGGTGALGNEWGPA